MTAWRVALAVVVGAQPAGVALSQMHTGAATFYHGDDDAPLYCAQFLAEELRYGEEERPFVAIDVGAYGHLAECGDWLYLSFADGHRMLARALDAGRLAGVQVDTTADGKRDTAILVDVPARWMPGAMVSKKVSVLNLSAIFGR